MLHHLLPEICAQLCPYLQTQEMGCQESSAMKTVESSRKVKLPKKVLSPADCGVYPGDTTNRFTNDW